MNEFFSNTILFGEGTLNSLHIYAGPAMDYFMISMTFLGDQLFYLIVLPVLYWCVNRKNALRIGLVFLFATILNAVVKEIYLNPRPNPDLLAAPIRELYMAHAPKSPGFPSGHTQSAVGFWGTAIIFSPGMALAAVSLALLILIPYSRLYLGVHYLGDVVGGYLLGGIALAVTAPLIVYFEKKGIRVNDSAVPVLLAVLPWIAYGLMPVMYLLKMTSILAGLVSGIILSDGRIVFTQKNRPRAQALKIAIGLSGLAMIFFAGNFTGNSPAARYAIYWIMGFWITFIAPLIFSRRPFLKGDAAKEAPAE